MQNLTALFVYLRYFTKFVATKCSSLDMTLLRYAKHFEQEILTRYFQCCTTINQERICYDPISSTWVETGCSLMYEIGTIAPGVMKVQ